jgi:class 3 adenylate cyclase
MASLESSIGIVTGIIAVLTTVVAVTRHLTKVQDQGERDKVAAENRDLLRKVAELEARRGQLLDQISVAGRAGSAALHQKTELDSALHSLMAATGASGGSIYVPVRSPRGEVHGLAFLCIEPFSNQTQVLRSKIIPLKSLAGRCFVSGESFVVVNAAKSPDHFQLANEIAEYLPSTTLNIALPSGGDVVGVLQLLSREGEDGFREEDVVRVSALIAPIAEGVAAISRSPDYLKTLGLGDDTKAVEGTILYFDLSGSALLFQELSSTFALDLLNEYFERVCEAAFRGGATMDTYMGDGALLRFNVPRPQPEHELAAVKAALEMGRAFQEMKEYWVAISPQLAAVQHRSGISTGPLLRANLGHSQVQNLTVIGHPVAVAAALCDAADRDRTVTLVSQETYVAVKDQVVAKELERARLGKAERFTDAAWEIIGLR